LGDLNCIVGGAVDEAPVAVSAWVGRILLE